MCYETNVYSLFYLKKLKKGECFSDKFCFLTKVLIRKRKVNRNEFWKCTNSHRFKKNNLLWLVLGPFLLPWLWNREKRNKTKKNTTSISLTAIQTKSERHKKKSLSQPKPEKKNWIQVLDSGHIFQIKKN